MTFNFKLKFKSRTVSRSRYSLSHSDMIMMTQSHESEVRRSPSRTGMATARLSARGFSSLRLSRTQSGGLYGAAAHWQARDDVTRRRPSPAVTVTVTVLTTRPGGLILQFPNEQSLTQSQVEMTFELHHVVKARRRSPGP